MPYSRYSCCELCGLLLVSILSCIFTHFLDTPEVSYCNDVAPTEWLNNWCPKRFYTSFTFHLRWQACSILWCRNALYWSKYWIVKLKPILPKETTCYFIGSIATLPLNFSFFLLILWRLWMCCVIEFLMARCITIMVFAVWQHVVWYMATNISVESH